MKSFASTGPEIAPQPLFLKFISGKVSFFDHETDSLLSFGAEDTLHGEVKIKTEANSSVEAVFDNGTSIIIGEESHINFTKMKIHNKRKIYRTQLHLVHGQIWVEEDGSMQKQTTWFDMKTHNARIFFRNSVSFIFIKDNTTFIDVYQGAVKVRTMISENEAVIKPGKRARVINGNDKIKIIDLDFKIKNNISARMKNIDTKIEPDTENSPSIAMLAVNSKVSDSQNLNTFSNYISSEIDKKHPDMKVLLYDNVIRVLKSENMENMIDCFTDSCLSYIASRLGVDMVVVGKIGKLGTRFIFNLNLIDVYRRKTINQTSKTVEEDMGKLLDKVPEMIDSLVTKDIIQDIVTPGSTEKESKPGPVKRINREYDAPPDMVYIPFGEFFMGSVIGEGEIDEWPRHEVRVGGFFMDKYEVTKSDFQQVMGYRAGTKTGCKTCPVNNVTWFEAKKYCSKSGKRLPSEAEWEYACRAGTNTNFHYGNSISSDLANFDGRYPYGGAEANVFRNEIMPAGSFEPNAFGLYDMHGNVMEWCADWYKKNQYRQSPKNKPTGPSEGKYKIARGGSYLNKGKSLRSAKRSSYGPSVSLKTLGFRCVKDTDKK